MLFPKASNKDPLLASPLFVSLTGIPRAVDFALIQMLKPVGTQGWGRAGPRSTHVFMRVFL